MRVAPLKSDLRLAFRKRSQERFLIVKQHEHRPRPHSSVIDPLRERLDFLSSQASFGRHLQIRVVKSNGFDQQTLRGLAGRTIKDIERQAIQETLKLTGGNKAEAAKRLGISRRALYDKIEKYGLGKG